MDTHNSLVLDVYQKTCELAMRSVSEIWKSIFNKNDGNYSKKATGQRS